MLDRVVPVLKRTSVVSTNKPEATKYNFLFYFILLLFIFNCLFYLPVFIVYPLLLVYFYFYLLISLFLF